MTKEKTKRIRKKTIVKNKESKPKRQKYGGRQKGVQNKITVEIKEKLQIIESSQTVDIILDSLNKLRETDILQFLKLHLEYCKLLLPKQIDLNNPDGSLQPTNVVLSDKQMSQYANLIK